MYRRKGLGSSAHGDCETPIDAFIDDESRMYGQSQIAGRSDYPLAFNVGLLLALKV